MNYRIETIKEKKLIGKKRRMSFSNNSTAELWKSFMPQRKQIANVMGSDLYSMQFYPPSFFDKFDPTAEFEKWAAMETSSFDSIPEGMETVTLTAGTYAVFSYKGPANSPAPFQYILQMWMPTSGYVLDSRPHFELLGEKYKNNDPDSEEEIWIPVRRV
jgi:AraC family transcriptional regulator